MQVMLLTYPPSCMFLEEKLEKRWEKYYGSFKQLIAISRFPDVAKYGVMSLASL